MNRYIAFLRGVNVGGNNKVAMPELRSLFEKVGFEDVITYINSGNVIFSSPNNEKEIQAVCENAIKQYFKVDILVRIISVLDLSNALNNAPLWWDNDKQSKHNAIFIIPPITIAEVTEQIGTINEEYEKVYCYENIIFWSVPLRTFSKTNWSKVSNKSIYNNITIRNANTTKKILDVK